MIQSTTNTANEQSSHPCSDYYQALVRRLESLRDDQSQDSMTVGITSSTHGEGVTTVATNLAISAAHSLQQSVLLVSTNSSGCSVDRIFNLQQKSGLAESLADPNKAVDYIEKTSHENLSILAVGSESLLAETVHDSKMICQLIESLQKQFDLIIFDLPVANQLTPCFAIASQLNAVLLVIESEKTKDQVIIRAKTDLLEANVNLQGVILNKRQRHIPQWLYQRI